MAATFTDFATGSLVYEAPVLALYTQPGTTSVQLTAALDAALAHGAAHGIKSVEIEVGQSDAVLADLLQERGFGVQGEAVESCWLDADAVPTWSSWMSPAVSQLPTGCSGSIRRPRPESSSQCARSTLINDGDSHDTS